MPNSKRRIALVSVTDKSGVIDFVRALVELGFRILSTGGTAKLLIENQLPVEQVSDFAETPEVFDGRVKTLHPKIHGGILYDRSNPEHVADAGRLAILPIDLLVVNLYQFARQALSQKLLPSRAIEFIDVGGPAMLRAAAKNHIHCLPVIDPSDYSRITAALRQGELPDDLRLELAVKTFAATAQYDAMIASYLTGFRPAAETFPVQLPMGLQRERLLRYGENPHQAAAVYGCNGIDVMQQLEILQGKELSYNNLIDLEAAYKLAAEFEQTSVAIIKHTNPCGVAVAETPDQPLSEVYLRAYRADSKSSFGGIVAVNRVIDKHTAEAMVEIFYECIIAPGVDAEAKEVFAKKKNLRVVVKSGPFVPSDFNLRSLFGGLLVQTEDQPIVSANDWRTVSKKAVATEWQTDLLTAMRVVKHVKSNAIVLMKNGVSLAIGAGQMSRIDAARFAILKAREFGHSLRGSVAASDAFFPFRDCVDLLAKEGVAAIVQPGGSLRDQDSIDACDEFDMAMIFTGKRHFKH